MSHWEILARMSLVRGDIPALVMYALLVGFLSLATPLAVQSLVETVAFGTLLQPVLILAVLLFVGLAFAATMQILQIRLLEQLQQRALVRLGLSMAERLPRLAAASYERLSADAAANRFYDVITVQKAGAALLLDGIALSLQTVIAMVLLSLYHPLLLGFNVLLLLCVSALFWGLGRGAQKTAIKESKQKHALASWLGELARPYELWRSERGAALGIARADAIAEEYLLARRAHFRVLGRQIIGALALQVFASTLLLGLGGWLVIKGQLTLGQLIASELILSAVLVGLAKLGKQLEKLYDLLAATDKLREVEGLPIESTEGHSFSMGSSPASLVLHEAGFSFPEGATVLQDAHLSITAGSLVGVRGESGAGKSTLAAILSGVYKLERGFIELDGVDQRTLSLRAWRHEVARVSGPEIFSGTIEENLSVGNEDISAEAQHRLLDALGLRAELRHLPQGLATVLRADGAPLSRGQAIRLTLARALLRRPRLLILDGILDELSPVAQRLVLNFLRRADSPWTILCMSNQDAVLASCDAVYELRGGALRLSTKNEGSYREMTSRVTPR